MKRRRRVTRPRRGLSVFSIVAASAAIVAAVVLLPSYLVDRALDDSRLDERDREELTAAELLKAKNDALTAVLQGLAGLGLLVGAGLTARTIHISREGQVTERFTRAIDQLGHEKRDVRLGGIYALERIAKDSASDHGPVMEILTTFLREHAQPDRVEDGPRLRADLQAAATVIGRRDARNDPPDFTVDLLGADLQGAYLFGANLRGAHLPSCNFKGALLGDADLRGANLAGAHLGAWLAGTNLENANLHGADLREAFLYETKLLGARADWETRWPPGLDPGVEGIVMEH